MAISKKRRMSDPRLKKQTVVEPTLGLVEEARVVSTMVSTTRSGGDQ